MEIVLLNFMKSSYLVSVSIPLSLFFFLSLFLSHCHSLSQFLKHFTFPFLCPSSSSSNKVGVLLEYDSDPEDIVDSPQGTFLGTAFATEERNQPESGTGSGSASEGQSSSFYRTRNHVRNLNLQTPL